MLLFNRLKSRIAMECGRMIAAARAYNLVSLRDDSVAGLSVAVVAIPQSMAYALVAGVPVEYGLYTLVIHALLGAVLSAGRFISLGPVNTQSLLIASVVTHVVGRAGLVVDEQMGPLYIELVFGLAVLKGLVQLALAAARVGRLVKYISHSVVVGFTAGAGLLIVAGQVPHFFGLPVGQTVRRLPGLLGTVEQSLPHLASINVRATLVGAATLVLIVLLRRSSKLIPGPFVAVAVAGAAVWLFGWSDAELTLIRPLPGSMPAFGIPSLDILQWESLFGGALALAVLGLLETYSINKSLAPETGQRVSANRELAAQGAINFVSGFFSCIPGSGSFSRSALNVYAGAATRFAGALCGLTVAAVIVFLAPVARYVPLASLAGVLVVIGFSLIDFRYIRDIVRADRADAAVCLVTLLATLLVPLQYAIFVGIFLNLALYLEQASRLQLMQMVPTDEGPFLEKPVVEETRKPQDIIFLQLEGDLFFGLADELGDRLCELAGSGAKVVIFRVKRTHYVDATVLDVFAEFVREFQKRGGTVLLCGVRPQLMDKLQAFGLLDRIGSENVFAASHGIFASAKRAIARAESLTGEPDSDGR